MSAYRFVTLTCDTCGEIWDDGITTSIREARRLAKFSGWVSSRGGRDECPVHHGYERTTAGGVSRSHVETGMNTAPTAIHYTDLGPGTVLVFHHSSSSSLPVDLLDLSPTLTWRPERSEAWFWQRVASERWMGRMYVRRAALRHRRELGLGSL